MSLPQQQSIAGAGNQESMSEAMGVKDGSEEGRLTRAGRVRGEAPARRGRQIRRPASQFFPLYVCHPPPPCCMDSARAR